MPPFEQEKKPTEIEKSQQTAEEDLTKGLNDSKDFEEAKKELNRVLFRLEVNVNTLKQRLATIEESLPKIKKRLEELEAKYPNDPDLKMYRAYYEDLKGDLKRKKWPILDTSMNNLLKEIKDEIASRQISTEAVDSPKIKTILDKLKGINLEPAYVVVSDNPNAKTVVLFAQVHSNPGIPLKFYDDIQVTTSQQKIFEATKLGLEKGITRTFYAEGWMSGKKLEDEDIDKSANENYLPMLKMAPYMLKKEFRDKVDIKGMEDVEFLKRAFNLQAEYGDMMHRTGLNNILIARNIAKGLESLGDDIAFAAIGAAHEMSDIGIASKNQYIPLSESLAYYGVNVVVVDTFNHAKAKEGFKKFSKWEKTTPKSEKIAAIVETLPKSKREKFKKESSEK